MFIVIIVFKSNQVLTNFRLAVHAGNLCWCVETPRAGNPQKAQKEVVGVQRPGCPSAKLTWYNLRWVKKHGEPCPGAAASGNAQMDLGKLGGVFIVVVLGMVSACFSLSTTHFFCHLPRPHSLRYLRVSLQSSSLPFSDESWPSMKMWVIQFNFCVCRDRFDASGFSSSRDVGGPTLCCWLEVFRNILLSKFSMFLLLLDG